MNILFVHQNFPGQYLHIINSLSEDKSNTMVGLGINPIKGYLPKNFSYFQYEPRRGNSEEIHPFALEIETKCIRGEACADAACQLQKQGFTPDIICAHPGWGESLFLKDIWPQSLLISYQEFFYQSEGFDYRFDPEFYREEIKWEQRAKVRMKAACIQMALEASDWNVTPTSFQKSSFPSLWRDKISTIHDGIDSNQAKPNPLVQPFDISEHKTLYPEQPIVTFINRVIEPYRGCHTFIRAIPAILAKEPTAEIVVVGAEHGQSYGISPNSGKSWKQIFLEEIDGAYNPEQVHFVGTLAYQRYLQLLQLSAVHVYLTYPFVLSWSCLEAMSCGCPIVGSSTPPVEEVLKHGQNGLLCDFFNPEELAQSVQVLLEDRILAKKLGCAARETILKKYSLKTCVNNHINLIKLVKGGSIVS